VPPPAEHRWLPTLPKGRPQCHTLIAAGCRACAGRCQWRLRRPWGEATVSANIVVRCTWKVLFRQPSDNIGTDCAALCLFARKCWHDRSSPARKGERNKLGKATLAANVPYIVPIWPVFSQRCNVCTRAAFHVRRGKSDTCFVFRRSGSRLWRLPSFPSDPIELQMHRVKYESATLSLATKVPGGVYKTSLWSATLVSARKVRTGVPLRRGRGLNSKISRGVSRREQGSA